MQKNKKKKIEKKNKKAGGTPSPEYVMRKPFVTGHSRVVTVSDFVPDSVIYVKIIPDKRDGNRITITWE